MVRFLGNRSLSFNQPPYFYWIFNIILNIANAFSIRFLAVPDLQGALSLCPAKICYV